MGVGPGLYRCIVAQPSSTVGAALAAWIVARPVFDNRVAGATTAESKKLSVEFAIRLLNYRGFSFGPNCADWFNRQRAVQRGQSSYVVAVMAPSDFAQL
jgi:hypothetical protein